jgi:ribose transport system permease protein
MEEHGLTDPNALAPAQQPDPVAASMAAAAARRRIILRILDNLVWVILVVVLAVFSITINGFMTTENFINIVYHSVFLGVVAIGTTYVLITGNLDLSIGSVAGFTAVLSAWLAGSSVFASGLHIDPFVVLVIALAVGAAAGFVNGFLVTKLRINAFLVTFATLTVVAGLALMLTQGAGVSGLPDSFRLIDTIRPLGIPLMTYLLVGLYVLFEFILRRTQFGAHLYIIGGNRTAANNFGIRVDAAVLRVFMFSGALAGLTGWLLAARLDGATPTVAVNLLFNAIAAAVIGGVSLEGGAGSLTGVLAGVLLLGSITTALDIVAVDPFTVQVIQGLLVLGAIILDSVKRRYR